MRILNRIKRLILQLLLKFSTFHLIFMGPDLNGFFLLFHFFFLLKTFFNIENLYVCVFICEVCVAPEDFCCFPWGFTNI